MSEDIRFKLTTDEGQAVNSFKRLRNEVLNNQQALDRVGKQGKLAGTALKDAASVLGPQFQILGDRIDHVSGALQDVQGAGMLAKASLVGLVAAGSWQVGTMLGEFIAQTEEWGRANAETIKGITADFDKLSKMQSERFENEVKLADLAATKEQRNQELSLIRMTKVNELADARLWLITQEQDLNVALANDFLGRNTEDNAIAQEGVRVAQERVKALEAQFEIVDRMRYGGSEIEEQIAARQRDAEALKAQTAEMKRQAAQQDAFNKTQTDFLFGLEAELVRLREGEEAYHRMTLAKQEFNEETIESAIQLRAEIAELNELARKKSEPKPDRESEPDSIRVNRPGEVRVQEQRFITRGPGMTNEGKILAATEKQLKAQQELLNEQKKQRILLEQRLPREVA